MERLLFIGCAPGNDVALLQTDLNAVVPLAGQGSAYATLTADGIFGGKTHNRVTEFQRINHLTADGVVGPITKAKLQSLVELLPGRVQQVGGGAGTGVGAKQPFPQKPIPATGKAGFGAGPGGSGGGVKGGFGSGGAGKPGGGPNQPFSGGKFGPRGGSGKVFK